MRKFGIKSEIFFDLGLKMSILVTDLERQPFSSPECLGGSRERTKVCILSERVTAVGVGSLLMISSLSTGLMYMSCAQGNPVWVTTGFSLMALVSLIGLNFLCMAAPADLISESGDL